jgi:hypothetical protein
MMLNHLTCDGRLNVPFIDEVVWVGGRNEARAAIGYNSLSCIPSIMT